VAKLPSIREVCLEGMAAVCADRWAFAGHNGSVRMSLRTALGAFKDEVQGMPTGQHMPIHIALYWIAACTRWAENQTGKGEPVSGRHVFCFMFGNRQCGPAAAAGPQVGGLQAAAAARRGDEWPVGRWRSRCSTLRLHHAVRASCCLHLAEVQKPTHAAQVSAHGHIWHGWQFSDDLTSFHF